MLRKPAAVRRIAWAGFVVLGLLLGACDRRTIQNAWSTADTVAANDPPLAAKLTSDRFENDPQRGGAIAKAWAAATKERGTTFGARVPMSAGGVFEVGAATTADLKSGARGDFVLGLHHGVLRDAPLTNDEGRAAYRDVAASTDLLVTSRAGALEWFYVLHDEAAPTHFAIDVELPRGLPRARPERDGSIAFLDRNGRARLVMPAAFAVDARGARREVTLAWDAARARLEVTLDARGLAFPLVVDPGLEEPVWEEVAQPNSPAAAENQLSAYDSDRQRFVLLGACADENCYAVTSDVWEWDGTSWAKRATTNAGPSSGAMAYDQALKKMIVLDPSGALWLLDATSSWSELPYSTAFPPPRSFAAMAYDSARDRIVLTGGYGATLYGDTWEWDGTSWLQRTSATSAPAAYGASMAYDSARAKMVLFGGSLSDAWEWDGTNWSDVVANAAPSPRTNASMAYDAARRRTLVFGGTSGTVVDELWSWDGTTWALESQGPPAARQSAAMAYDSARAKTVLFGGCGDNCAPGDLYSQLWEWDGSNWAAPATKVSIPTHLGAAVYETARALLLMVVPATPSNQTWEWDGTTWTQRTPPTSMAPRSSFGLTYDERRHRAVAFGGYDLTDASGEIVPLVDDVWEWDGTTWEQRSVSSGPAARFPVAMTYDVATGVSVLFGGFSDYQQATGYQRTNDTWGWDGTTWTMYTPAHAPPLESGGPTSTYDAARARVLLEDQGTLWEWDGTDWTAATPATSPTSRTGGALGFDPVRAKVILFGGQSSTAFLDDTWEWDGTSWSQVSTASPSARTGAEMVFDAATSELLLLGGAGPSQSFDEMWRYFTVGKSCTTTSTCDTGSCVDGVCCAQSACGACQACNLPGNEGVCTNVPAGTVPTTGDPGVCAPPSVCSAGGSCSKQLGSLCSVGADCVSGFCTDGVCCDTACDGVCQACSTGRGLAQDGTCAFAPAGIDARTACAANFDCNGKGASCPVSCADDTACAHGYYCDASGACVPQKSGAAVCDDAAGKDCSVSGCRECAVGNCVDGACCASCHGTAALGASCTNDATCASDHCVGGTCCGDTCGGADGGVADTCQQGTCVAANGYTCALPIGNACRAESCSGTTQTFLAVCDGNGGCGALQTNDCSPYACGATTCKTTCTSDTDCATSKGYHCDTRGTCVAGVTCSADGTVQISSDGTQKACGAYACAAQGCKSSCASIGDCATGFVCGTSAQCERAGASNPVAANGCSCRVGAGADGNRDACACVFAVIVGAWCARRRRGRTEATSARASKGTRTRDRLLLLFTASMAIACDASRAHPSAASSVDEFVAHDATLATKLASDPFVEDGQGGALANAWSAVTKEQGLILGARLPPTADGAIAVGLATGAEAHGGAGGDFVLALRHEGARGASLINEGKGAAYVGFAPSADLRVVATDARVEWFYLLHDAAAPTHFTLDVTLPKGLPRAMSRPDGSLAFLDARGRARLTMPPPFLVDAKGARREVTLTWDRARAAIDLRFDPRGLAYPLLVDPAVEHAVWEQAGADGPSARVGGALAYDGARGVSVLFGGAVNGLVLLDDTWTWDGARWTAHQPAASPSLRESASMAYDAGRGVVVLFGGFLEGDGISTASTALNDTWEWDGTTWTSRPTLSTPPARSSAAMAYDRARAKTVLYGGEGYVNVGYDEFLALGDAWEWDGTSWAQVAAPGAAGGSATMAHDATRARTVLLDSSAATWEWDGTSWAEIAEGSAPGPSAAGAAMAYDATIGASVVASEDSDGVSTDLWSWNGTVWTSIASSAGPSARSGEALAYDEQRGRIVFAFGADADGARGDTWEWDGATWFDVVPRVAPAPRSLASMAFDSRRGRAVLFGGDAGQDTWEWDGTVWRFAAAAPATPMVSTSCGIAYDSARGVTVIFGSDDYSATYGNTWEWDGTTWTQRVVTPAPPPRSGGMMAYDSGRKTTVLFGGANQNGSFYGGNLNDTWEWDGTTWTERVVALSPPPRIGASLAYDSKRARTVLFGSWYGNVSDTWEWDGTSWTKATPPAYPPTRAYGAMAYDSVRGKTVVAGGSGDYANLSTLDTWEWDGTLWTEQAIAHVPGRQGPAMAFDSARGTIVMFGGDTPSGVANDTWLYFHLGASCTTTSTCDLGFCTDGVCCNQAQCGACQACDLAGSEGTCTNVPAGTYPATNASNVCTTPNVCTANGVCALPNGTSCSDGAACLSGFCADGVCCESACSGDCQACSTARGLAEDGICAFAPEGKDGRTTCANHFACDGKEPSCPTSCAEDASCAAGFYCDRTGACVAQKVSGASCDDTAGNDCLRAGCRECAQGNCVNGACCATCAGTTAIGGACTNGASCTSGNCVGGVCCNDTCAGSDGGSSDACAQGVCAAANGYHCALPADNECRAGGCIGATQTFVAVCDGHGACGALQTRDCTPYVCGASECKSRCTADSDCVTAKGYECDTTSGTCVVAVSCSADKTQEVSSAGVMTSCGAYVCASGGCKTSCTTVGDCASGFVCDVTNHCTIAATSTPTTNNGCSCRAAGRARSNGDEIAIVALVGWALRRRRARSRGAR